MKRLWIAGVLVACVAVLGVGVSADDDVVVLRARAVGANEVPPIFTAATANFKATIHSDGSINFTLDFKNLSANLTASHIHFAQKNVQGAVMIPLCGGGQPACPAATSGIITGTIAPANVVAIPGQGIVAGHLADALRVIGNGEGYVNLHNASFPSGEIRGQVSVHGDDD